MYILVYILNTKLILYIYVYTISWICHWDTDILKQYLNGNT